MILENMYSFVPKRLLFRNRTILSSQPNGPLTIPPTAASRDVALARSGMASTKHVLRNKRKLVQLWNKRRLLLLPNKTRLVRLRNERWLDWNRRTVTCIKISIMKISIDRIRFRWFVFGWAYSDVKLVISICMGSRETFSQYAVPNNAFWIMR